jgi:hypothetical protein
VAIVLVSAVDNEVGDSSPEGGSAGEPTVVDADPAPLATGSSPSFEQPDASKATAAAIAAASLARRMGRLVVIFRLRVLPSGTADNGREVPLAPSSA